MVKPRRSAQEIEVQTLPLIDVVFLLLTFFLFALVLTTRVDVLDIQLPTGGEEAGQTEGSRDDAVLVVRSDGSLALDGAVVESQGLAGALVEAGVVAGTTTGAQDAAIDDLRGLVIAVDAATPSATLFDVVEQLGNLGVSGLRFLRVPDGARVDTGARDAGAGDVGAGDAS